MTPRDHVCVCVCVLAAVLSLAGACRGLSVAPALQLRETRIQPQHAVPLHEPRRRAHPPRHRGRLQPGNTNWFIRFCNTPRRYRNSHAFLYHLVCTRHPAEMTFPPTLGAVCGQLTFRLAWCCEPSAVMATELLQPRDLACGTLFQSSCVIPTSPTDCSIEMRRHRKALTYLLTHFTSAKLSWYSI